MKSNDKLISLAETVAPAIAVPAKDKLKARDEAKRLEGRHERRAVPKNEFTPGKPARKNPESANRKSG